MITNNWGDGTTGGGFSMLFFVLFSGISKFLHLNFLQSLNFKKVQKVPGASIDQSLALREGRGANLF